MEACLDAINDLGLKFGGFSDSYGTKGCYAYASGPYAKVAFYGTEGTDDEVKKDLTLPKYRPAGHDCKAKGSFSNHIKEIGSLFVNNFTIFIA